MKRFLIIALAASLIFSAPSLAQSSNKVEKAKYFLTLQPSVTGSSSPTASSTRKGKRYGILSVDVLPSRMPRRQSDTFSNDSLPPWNGS